MAKQRGAPRAKTHLPEDVRERLLNAFAEDLRDYRTAAGLTQHQLGTLALMHFSEIGLLERGQREPRLGTLIKLASALDLPLERLLETAAGVYEYVPRSGWRGK